MLRCFNDFKEGKRVDLLFYFFQVNWLSLILFVIFKIGNIFRFSL